MTEDKKFYGYEKPNKEYDSIGIGLASGSTEVFLSFDIVSNKLDVMHVNRQTVRDIIAHLRELEGEMNG